VNLKKNQELDLPLQSKQNADEPLAEKVSPEDVKAALKAAREKFGRTTVTKALQQAKQQLGKQGVAKLTLLGGAAAVGLFLSGAVLTSLEVLPVVPEAMQAVGLAYSVVVASRVIRGAPEKFKVSPIRAVLEIVEEGGKMTKQRTSLVIPQVRLCHIYSVYKTYALCILYSYILFPSDMALRHMSTKVGTPICNPTLLCHYVHHLFISEPKSRIVILDL